MPPLSIQSPASLIILASATFDRVVGPAFPLGQLDVVGHNTLGDLPKVSASLQPGQPTFLLIDRPIPSPTLTQQLNTSTVYLGLLFLVDTNELDQVLPLGWAGPTGWVFQDDWITNLTPVAIAARRGEMILAPTMVARALGQRESNQGRTL